MGLELAQSQPSVLGQIDQDQIGEATEFESVAEGHHELGTAIEKGELDRSVALFGREDHEKLLIQVVVEDEDLNRAT